MTLNEYQKKCISDLPKYLYRGDEAILSLLTLESSAGELCNMYMKSLYEGAELPQEAFVKELGNVIRCVAIAAHAVDVDLVTVLKTDVGDQKS